VSCPRSGLSVCYYADRGGGVLAAAPQPVQEPIDADGAEVEGWLLDPIGQLAGRDGQDRVTTQDGARTSAAMDRGDPAQGGKDREARTRIALPSLRRSAD
jgi:hypothetical protein